MPHLCDVVAGPAAWRHNVLASTANTPFSDTPLLNLPDHVADVSLSVHECIVTTVSLHLAE